MIEGMMMGINTAFSGYNILMVMMLSLIHI